MLTVACPRLARSSTHTHARAHIYVWRSLAPQRATWCRESDVHPPLPTSVLPTFVPEHRDACERVSRAQARAGCRLTRRTSTRRAAAQTPPRRRCRQTPRPPRRAALPVTARRHPIRNVVGVVSRRPPQTRCQNLPHCCARPLPRHGCPEPARTAYNQSSGHGVGAHQPQHMQYHLVVVSSSTRRPTSDEGERTAPKEVLEDVPWAPTRRPQRGERGRPSAD